MDRTARRECVRVRSRCAHDYRHHGLSAPFAVLEHAPGRVNAGRRSRRRSVGFLSLPRAIDSSVPAELGVYVILYNSAICKTTLVPRGLGRAVHTRQPAKSEVQQVGIILPSQTEAQKFGEISPTRTCPGLAAKSLNSSAKFVFGHRGNQMDRLLSP